MSERTISGCLNLFNPNLLQQSNLRKIIAFCLITGWVFFSYPGLSYSSVGLIQTDPGDSTEKINTPSRHKSRYNIKRSIRATPLKDSEIEMDGQLTEPIWSRVEYTSGFTQRDPDEGQPATEETKVAFVYGEEALYIGARMFSHNPEDIRATMARRDNYGNSERLVVSLDTYLDRRTAYNFAVTAAGVRVDYYHPEDEMGWRTRDFTYDPVWTAVAHIDSIGWTAEMRIPYNQLRFSKQSTQIWGLNINRYIPNKSEDVLWRHIPKSKSGWASNFGLLTGIHNIEQSLRLEFLPYAAGEAKITGNPDPDDPFEKKVDLTKRIGGNIEWGIGSNMTMNATINPDFGQVEADPAQVNLSAFETRFDEKRPFFTEGNQLLQGRGATYFYSRRIGASPSYRPGAPYADMNKNTTILGAAKLTGRTPRGLSVGGLAAVTADEYADIAYSDSGAVQQVKVEPLTGYGVGRVQKEFGPNASTAGLILTGVNRRLDTEHLSQQLADQAVTGGGDWVLRFMNGSYEFSGNVGFSHLNGSSEAINRIQRSSAHYYQRPDADYLALDSSRTQLSGYRASFGFSKRDGEHWLWNLGGIVESPGFDINDMGIMRSADRLGGRYELTYQENNPGSWYQDYEIELSAGGLMNFGGIHKASEINLEGDVEFHNYWSLSAEVELEPRHLDDRRTRGGPLMGETNEWVFRFRFRNDRGSSPFFQLSQEYRFDKIGGWQYEIEGEFDLQTGGHWIISINPEFVRQTEMHQYLTTLPNGPEATFGERYVFASIDRSRISAQFRINYALNPDLSLEVYAEPFAASGNYYSPGELPHPRSYRLRRYGEGDTQIERTNDGEYRIYTDQSSFQLEDPDFKVLSFRSNVVLRWQWRKGSTLYLVWNQNRFSELFRDQFVVPGDLLETFSAAGDNTLALKFTYWLPADEI